MGPFRLVLAGALVLSTAYVLFVYMRREVPVAGRRLLALSRVTVLVLLGLLLLDPSLPVTGAPSGSARSWILLDGSLSMSAGTEGDPSPWATAVERARAMAGDDDVIMVFGGEEVEPLARVGARGPTSLGSRLTPALERAGEAAADSVRLLGDLRVEDPAAAKAALLRLGLPLRVERVGGGVSGAGTSGFTIPRAVSAGEGVPAEVVVFPAGAAAGDSATLEIREEGRLVLSARVELPSEGRVLRMSPDLPEPRESGEVRYAARIVHPDDAFADDDERVAYTTVDPEVGNLVLVSLHPDWEPRFLLPVLGRVTGLPVRGYLDVGAAGFLAMRPGGATEVVAREVVARQAADAEILVVQGLSAVEPPGWIVDALERVARSIVFPRSAAGAAAVGIDAGRPRPGEWYVSSELPPSPLAGDLAGGELEGLPPLTGVLALARDGQGSVPLAVQLRGTGPAEAALALLRPPDGGRRAVALAEGFWRWAFRAGPSRDAYERLWSGVAGWLLADEVAVAGPVVRPLEKVNPRGGGVEWAAPRHPADTVALTLLRNDSVVLDTAVAVSASGGFRTPGLPPGTYRYRARPSRETGESEGRFDVESYTDELAHPPVADLETTAGLATGRGAASPGGRPLRTHPLPYLAILALLCMEWIGRRRQGLR